MNQASHVAEDNQRKKASHICQDNQGSQASRRGLNPGHSPTIKQT
jgi:hypothetical protein